MAIGTYYTILGTTNPDTMDFELANDIALSLDICSKIGRLPRNGKVTQIRQAAAACQGSH